MKAVVFDMDGILFDTERLCMEGWSQIAKKKRISGMEEVGRQCIGLNEKDTKQLILNHYGESFPYEEFRAEVSKWMEKVIERKGLPVKPGVHKILSHLRNRHIPMGLASSTRYAKVISHLKRTNLIDYFQVIVSGDMIEHSKPQPDIYLLACNKLGVNPKEAYAIEDSPNGIRAAHGAGMRAIMVPDLIEPDREMEELSYLICKDLMEVMHFLDQ